MTVQVHDVIQLDPAHCEWGPLLCIVSEVKSWGVKCYLPYPLQRGEPPSQMFLQCKHEHYVVIGRAEWASSR